jgi:hypothetical protein
MAVKLRLLILLVLDIAALGARRMVGCGAKKRH